MNTGTKVRTALRIATSLNTAAYVGVAIIGDLGIEWLTYAWGIFVVITDIVVAGLTTYYNNDYTPEMAEATGYGRMMKAQKNGEVLGENFFDEVEEIEGGEDNA